MLVFVENFCQRFTFLDFHGSDFDRRTLCKSFDPLPHSNGGNAWMIDSIWKDQAIIADLHTRTSWHVPSNSDGLVPDRLKIVLQRAEGGWLKVGLYRKD